MALKSPFEDEKTLNKYSCAPYVKQCATSLKEPGAEMRTRLKGEGEQGEEDFSRFRALLSHYSKLHNYGKYRTKVDKNGWMWLKKIS